MLSSRALVLRRGCVTSVLRPSLMCTRIGYLWHAIVADRRKQVGWGSQMGSVEGVYKDSPYPQGW